MPPPAAEPDPLADLRDQLRATQAAAARLAGDGKVPPQGWASPRADDAGTAPDDDAGLTAELQQLVAVVGTLRELVPPELQQQVTDLIRQILLLVRALLDRVIEHLEPARGGEPDVEDIPIS